MKEYTRTLVQESDELVKAALGVCFCIMADYQREGCMCIQYLAGIFLVRLPRTKERRPISHPP